METFSDSDILLTDLLTTYLVPKSILILCVRAVHLCYCCRWLLWYRKVSAVSRCFTWPSSRVTRNYLLTYYISHQSTSTRRRTDVARRLTSHATQQVDRPWFSDCMMPLLNTHFTFVMSLRHQRALTTAVCRWSSCHRRQSCRQHRCLCVNVSFCVSRSNIHVLTMLETVVFTHLDLRINELRHFQYFYLFIKKNLAKMHSINQCRQIQSINNFTVSSSKSRQNELIKIV